MTSGRPLSWASFQAWNSSSSSARSAPSNSRPPTRSTKLRASKVRPERRGPVRIVALTGHMLHLRKWSKASRLASDRMQPGVARALRPVERQRDLVGAALHWLSVTGGWLARGGWAGAGVGTGGGSGTGGGGPAPPDIRTTVPLESADQPRAISAAASCRAPTRGS